MMFFFSSRRRHTRLQGDWSSDVCSSDLVVVGLAAVSLGAQQPSQALGFLLAGAEGAGHLDGDRGLRQVEIGRASCRGRGEISVVAGSLKKKKTEFDQ